jgi:hypothetical protein
VSPREEKKEEMSLEIPRQSTIAQVPTRQHRERNRGGAVAGAGGKSELNPIGSRGNENITAGNFIFLSILLM